MRGTGSVALITGASSGLGKAVADRLGVEGYCVALCARSYRGWKLGRGNWTSWYEARVDVRRYAEVKKFAAEVLKRFGKVDVLVNNAGIVHPRKPVQEIRHADFDAAFETHFCGPLGFIEAVLPGMLERHSGVIVNVASKAARYAVPGFAAYNASKAALVSLTQTLAKEVKGTGVRVYSVSPGGMNTGMRQEAFGDAGVQQDPAIVARVITEIVAARKYSQPDYPDLSTTPSGADVLVWKGQVEVFEMQERF